MYLLDTVTISDSEKMEGDAGLREFLSAVRDEDLHISGVSIGELYYGWALLSKGMRRDSIQTWLENVENRYAGRVLLFDDDVAKIWGALRADIRKSGFTIDFTDLMIAATALQHDLTVVTRNVRDFEPTGCRVLDPWNSTSGTVEE